MSSQKNNESKKCTRCNCSRPIGDFCEGDIEMTTCSICLDIDDYDLPSDPRWFIHMYHCTTCSNEYELHDLTPHCKRCTGECCPECFVKKLSTGDTPKCTLCSSGELVVRSGLLDRLGY